jgi:hypothetical protein
MPSAIFLLIPYSEADKNYSKRLAFNREGRLAPAKTFVSCVEGFFSVVSVNLWHYQAIMQRQAADPFV